MSSPGHMTSSGSSYGFSPKKKDVTRYGAVKISDVSFGNEERFQWQNANRANDVAYNLPTMTMTRSVRFGYSLRQGMDEINPDNKKKSTGPGSYNPDNCYDFNSEYVKKSSNRFSCATRQSMVMKTPSPGAVYNIENKYYLGPEKKIPISFPVSNRDNRLNRSITANADLYLPKADTGPAITIAKKFKKKFEQENTPGAIYDVHVCKYFLMFYTIIVFYLYFFSIVLFLSIFCSISISFLFIFFLSLLLSHTLFTKNFIFLFFRIKLIFVLDQLIVLEKPKEIVSNLLDF